MPRSLKLLFLGVIMGVTLVLMWGIYFGGDPRDIFGETSGPTGKGFKPIAEKVKIANEGFRKAEEELKHYKLDPAFDAMVLVPQGDFVMGSHEGGYDEQPERKIFLPPYYIDRYEVTFAQYYGFVAATEHRKPRLIAYLGKVETED